MKKSKNTTRAPGRPPGKESQQVPDNGNTQKPVDTVRPRATRRRKPVVLVGRLHKAADDISYPGVYAIRIDGRNLGRIKRMGAATQAAKGLFMIKYDFTPWVFSGLPRNLSKEGYANEAPSGIKEYLVVHLNKQWCKIEELPVIDGDLSKYHIPTANSQLRVYCDGSFEWEFALGSLGKFCTQHLSIKEVEDMLRGKLPENTK